MPPSDLLQRYCGKTVARIARHGEARVVIRFTDGATLGLDAIAYGGVRGPTLSATCSSGTGKAPKHITVAQRATLRSLLDRRTLCVAVHRRTADSLVRARLAERVFQDSVYWLQITDNGRAACR